MRLMVAGDWHGDYRWAVKMLAVCKMKEIKVVIQVGDFGFIWQDAASIKYLNDAAARAGVEIWWLDGNHENYSMMGALGCDPVGDVDVWVEPHIRYLPRGFRFEVDGCRFMSFGGAISVDRNVRQPGRSYFPQEAIRPHVADAVSSDKVDVFLSHDAPNDIPVLSARLRRSAHMWPADALRDSDFNRVLLSEVVDRVQPDLLIHGHYHYPYSDTRGDTRVIGLDCNGAHKAAHTYTIIDTEDYHE